MKVLILTPYWPTSEHPSAGIFVKRQVDLLTNKGVNVDVYHLKGNGNVLNYFKSIFTIRKIINSANYDLVHAHWGYSALPALLTTLPLIITFRGSDLMGTYSNSKMTATGRLIILFSKLAAKFAKILIFVSNDLSKLVDTKKTKHIIPSGLDFNSLILYDKDRIKKELGLPLDKKIIIFPNDPTREVKRYDLFLDTINLLNSDIIYPLVIYGVEHSILIKYLRASDFLLFTSKHEGSPNVIKEALALNIPIVSVNVGDVKQRISNIRGCFLVDNDTPEALSKALEVAIKYEYVDYNSRDTVKSLNEDLLISKLINLYKICIKFA